MAGQWRGRIIVMSILSLLIAGLTGCGTEKLQNIDPNNKDFSAVEPEAIPMPLPDGARLKHFYITHQGMQSGSYYILKTTDAGTYMKITNLRPNDWEMLDGEDVSSLGEHVEYLGFADTVKDCERASLVLLEDDTPVQKLEEAIARSGALGWDGFRKHVSMADVKDSGDSYQLYLELSDGTAVTVDSYNANPAGFNELLRQTEEIFHANKDYSRYQVNDFGSSECTRLYVCFRRTFGRGEWQLELRNSDNQWTVILTDPEGQFLDTGTNIADYRQVEGSLSFDRFLNVFKHHSAENWNGYEASDGNSEETFDIRLNYENGKEFIMSGSLPPEGFEDFRKELIEEIHLFYHEQTS